MSSLYERRVEQEWRLLHGLAAANSQLLAIDGRRIQDGDEVFQFTIFETAALIGDANGLQVRNTHTVAVRFPAFFPSVPLELSLGGAVFHPNVHPENGFVCLWDRFSSHHTLVDAIAQLQRVIAWQLFNETPDHLMQPGALAWQRNPARSVVLPLAFEAIRRPPELQNLRSTTAWLAPRRRLS
jgi:ubiquitin-protein ligase